MNLKISAFLLYLEYILLALIVLFKGIGAESLASMCFSFTFVVTFLLWFIYSLDKLNSISLIALFTVGCSVFSVFGNAFFSSCQFGVAYFKKVIFFSSTILYFDVCLRIDVNRRFISFISFINSSIVLFWIFMFFYSTPTMYVMNGRISAYLSLGLDNPNKAAIFILAAFLLEFVMLFFEKKLFWKIYHFVLIVFLTFFIIRTQSRNCLLIGSVFVLIALLYMLLPNFSVHFKKRWIIFIILFPLIFAFGYMLLINTIQNDGMFGFLVSDGKELSSREGIWEFAMGHLVRSPIFGAYAQISDGTGISQMHNTHIDTMASYGIITFILLMVFLYKVMAEISERGKSKYMQVSVWSFVIMLLSGVGEAMLFSGGLAIYLYGGFFIIFTRSIISSEDICNENSLYQ